MFARTDSLVIDNPLLVPDSGGQLGQGIGRLSLDGGKADAMIKALHFSEDLANLGSGVNGGVKTEENRRFEIPVRDHAKRLVLNRFCSCEQRIAADFQSLSYGDALFFSLKRNTMLVPFVAVAVLKVLAPEIEAL
jgi:hypothetical protein